MGNTITIKRTNQKTLLSNNEFEGLCVIQHFPDIHHDKEGEFDESPIFFTGQNDEYQWALDIMKAGYESKYSENVSIRFCVVNGEDVHLNELASLHFIASIVDDDGEKYLKKIAIINHEMRNASIFKDFILRKELEDNPKLLPNGELRIAFKIFFPETRIEKIKPSQIRQLKILDEVLDAGNYTDFKLIVRGKEFNVHRVILAARSPVFETMFTSDMRESIEGKVEIDDVEPAVMKKLLRSIYVGDVEDFEEIVDKVLVAADKYQIDELRHMCEDVLVERLSLANVYETLRLADENNAENLKEKTIAFFHRKAQKLYAEPDFKVHLNTLPGHLKTDIICLFIIDKL